MFSQSNGHVKKIRRKKVPVPRKDIRPSLKMERIASFNSEAAPRSYCENNPTENLVLRCVNHFTTNYVATHIDHCEPNLCPLNECGVNKFLSLTVQPTNLGYDELYTYEHCASFVRDYLTYEPLRDPTIMPTHVVSPHTTMLWQTGDCFDLTMVLLSLLVGVGYDAYGVVGYAPKWITLNDTSNVPFTLPPHRLSGLGIPKVVDPSAEVAVKPTVKAKPADGEGDEINEEEEEAARPAPPAYAFIKKKPKISAFLDESESRVQAIEQARLDAIAKKYQDMVDADAAAIRQAEYDDILHGHRFHSWVLVLPTHRQCPSTLFIDPGSGLVFESSDSPFLGIEYVFNQRNAWVSLKDAATPEHKLGTPSVLTTNKTTFNFGESDWGRVLDDVDLDIEQSEKDKKALMDRIVQQEEDEAESRQQQDESLDNGGAGNESTVSLTSNSEKRVESEAELQFKAKMPVWRQGQVDIPTSWVQRLVLSTEQFLTRYPGGSRTFEYKNVLLKCVAMYSRFDGLVTVYSVFPEVKPGEPLIPLTQRRPSTIREFFASRIDMMYERVTDLTGARPVVTEYFKLPREGPGKGLKELVTIFAAHGPDDVWMRQKEERIFHFYRSTERILDCLVKRHEFVGIKTKDTFDDRYDRLIYRSTYIDPSLSPRDPQTHRAPVNGSKGAGEFLGARFMPPRITKITEKFLRDESKAADDDVAKWSFCRKKAVETHSPQKAKAGSTGMSSHYQINSITNAAKNVDGGPIDDPLEVMVVYHFAPQRITSNMRFYKLSDLKTPIHKAVQVDPFQAVPSAAKLVEIYDKELVPYYKGVEMKCEEFNLHFAKIIQQREAELALPLHTTAVEPDVWEKARRLTHSAQREFGDEGDEDKDKDAVKDLLLPYLKELFPPQTTPAQLAEYDLSHEQAKQVRLLAISSLKDRVIDRARIIQDRIDEENKELTEKKEQLLRKQGAVHFEEEEMLTKHIQEASFRRDILRQRLKRHEEQSLIKYVELQDILHSDRRMQECYKEQKDELVPSHAASHGVA